ncbi:MAG: hypothetical protein PHP25_02895 [Candidatus Moranbacteria bacterium]|nr:hypothetical protein [Candidatus Moranbacteria bacterium]
MTELKKLISNILLSGAAMALVFFVVSLFLPRYWQVSGKVVVFPSGKPISASQNLSSEVGNTAWIVNSDTFQKNNFGDFAADFAGATVVGNSSMVLVKFKAPQADIQKIEDLIVKIPSQVDEYARDLYDGSPFKYKMASDPEASANYVNPDLRKNSLWGFAVGAVLYFLFWLFAGSFFVAKKETVGTEEEMYPETVSFPTEAIPYEPAPEHMPMPEPMPEIVPETEKQPTPQVSSVPDNLPVAPASLAGGEEYHEPSDEEVKDRLNKLMRGEL